MSHKSPVFIIFIGVMFLSMTILVGIAEARGGRGGGGRGGGGFSRSSAARGGSFSSRSASSRQSQPANRQVGTAQRPAPSQSQRENASQRQGNRQDADRNNQGDRQDARNEAREDRQEHRDQNREDWQNYGDDQWDDHYRHGYNSSAVYVGMPATSTTYVTVLPCAGTQTVVNGSTYYQCGNDWYSRGFEGGSVVYIASSPPPGY